MHNGKHPSKLQMWTEKNLNINIENQNFMSSSWDRKREIT